MSTEHDSAHPIQGTLLALLAALGFSLKAIFVKLAYASYPVDAITLLALRMLLSLPGFLLLAYLGGGASSERLAGHDWWKLIGLGMTGYYLSSLFDFYGLQYISSGLERMILFTYPTIVLLIEAAMHRRRLSGRLMAAMLLTYLGLLLAFGHDLHQQADDRLVWIGSAGVFLSGLTYAIYSVGTGAVVRRIGATRLAGYTGCVACIAVLLQFAIQRSWLHLAQLPASVLWWATAMALFSTVLPIWLLSKAMSRIGASHATAIGTLGPVITLSLGWLVLHDPFSWAQVGGMLLVIGGVVWLGVLKRRS